MPGRPEITTIYKAEDAEEWWCQVRPSPDGSDRVVVFGPTRERCHANAIRIAEALQ